MQFLAQPPAKKTATVVESRFLIAVLKISEIFLKIEKQFGVVFNDYFSNDLPRLSDMEADGLLSIDTGSIRVMDKGKLFIRNICMVFDAYLASSKTQFSKTI